MHKRPFRLASRKYLAPLLLALLPTTCSHEQTEILRDEAEVLIDSMGVPHIFAANDADAFIASGYTMAKLRLFQIEMIRRQASGTTAEVLGERAVRGDVFARTMQFGEWGKKARLAVMQDYPADAQLIEAFVRGINLYIERVRQGQAPLPAEMAADALNFQPTPFTDDDPYIIGKLLSFGMSGSLDNELLASALPVLAPNFPADFPLCMPTREAFTMPSATKVTLTGPGQLHSLASPAPAYVSPQPSRDAKEQLRLRTLWQEALSHYKPLSPKLGSNNWAVSGKHTESGRSMVCGDPHQPLGSPIRFFAQHLNTQDKGGNFDVVGFGFAGTPGVQLGHNRTVGWTATTNFADVMDLWDVAWAGTDKVLLGGQARTVVARKERIRVRAASGPAVQEDAQGEVREFVINDVPGFGVLMPDDLFPVPRALLTKNEVLFNWTGFAATHEAAMYLGLDRSRSLDQWDAAAKRLEVGAVNLVAADSKHIRYRVAAQVPDRSMAVAQGVQPWRMMNGNDAKTLWTGRFLTDDRLPSARDPERGYLATANNDPWGFTADGRVDNDPYYYGYFYDPGDRAYRIETELKRLVLRGKVTPADMAALQADARMALADDLLPALAQTVAELGTDPALEKYRGRPELSDLFVRLSGWDRQMRRDSAEAVMFFAFAHFATKRALGDELGPFLPTLFDAEPAFAFKPLRLALKKVPGADKLLQEGRNAILMGGLADAADWLKMRFGTVLPTMQKPYAWKDVHSASFHHLLGSKWDGRNVAVDGSVGTVNVSSATMLNGKGEPKETWAAEDGSLYRMITTFDDSGQPQAVVNFPRGNDENPQSPFYNNQTAAWADVKHAPLLYRRADVEKNVAQKFTLRRDGSLAE
jgi:penicillin amidase